MIENLGFLFSEFLDLRKNVFYFLKLSRNWFWGIALALIKCQLRAKRGRCCSRRDHSWAQMENISSSHRSHLQTHTPLHSPGLKKIRHVQWCMTITELVWGRKDKALKHESSTQKDICLSQVCRSHSLNKHLIYQHDSLTFGPMSDYKHERKKVSTRRGSTSRQLPKWQPCEFQRQPTGLLVPATVLTLWSPTTTISKREEIAALANYSEINSA